MPVRLCLIQKSTPELEVFSPAPAQGTAELADSSNGHRDIPSFDRGRVWQIHTSLIVTIACNPVVIVVFACRERSMASHGNDTDSRRPDLMEKDGTRA